ncbi:MAG TPA: hypothetical protein VIM29_11830 [Bacillota bacterium]
MIRHYLKNRLRSANGPLLTTVPTLWDLPPYQIARFGGELSKVMIEAAIQYIFEQSYLRQRISFETEAFRTKTKT